MSKLRSILVTVAFVLALVQPILTQRNLLVFKQDLEYRLGSYLNQRRTIDDILTSSISPNQQQQQQQQQVYPGLTKIAHTGGRIRFTDLIITNGSLILDRHNARPTVRMLVNKTRDYVAAKMNELYQVRSQLDSVKHQIDTHQYIYKGLPNGPTLPVDNRKIIRGTRLFKQFIYGRAIQSQRIQVAQVNYTNVDHVINETYMANAKVGLLDPQSRLFFEGKKTFWHTTFTGHLRSGCCHRLKPFHTDKMMRKSKYQEILAPIMFHTNDMQHKSPIYIRNLTVPQMYNRILAFGLINNRPDNNGLIPSPPENFINMENLIHIRGHPLDIAPIPKRLIFKDVTLIDQARLYSPVNDRALSIGLANEPGFLFDLNHHNYLLKFMNIRGRMQQPNATTIPMQFVAGTTIINSEAYFQDLIDANLVNRIPRFDLFIRNNVVRIDRPAMIRGPVQFSALPTIFTNAAGFAQPPRSVPIMMANKELKVGSVNGMRIPEDLVFLPPSPYALPPNQVIHVRGPREFVNRVNFEHLHVYKKVNEMVLPQEAIPLHLNDFISSTGNSNLMFVDGIVGQHLTVHGGHFDNIQIRDSDAQNIIMRSVFMLQPDGSHLVRAPLHINNLRLLAKSPNTGLLNNFRPQTLLELTKQPVDMPLFGNKQFLGLVEADDCIFNQVNDIENWSNHLIRIDRPNLIQNVHTRLAFNQVMVPGANVSANQPLQLPTPQAQPQLLGSVDIARFRIEFYPDDSVNQPDNWNISPEFYMMNQALIKALNNNTAGRYRVLDQVRLIDQRGQMVGRVNGIDLNDIVTLDKPFRFSEGYVMVGKVVVDGNLRASRISSNYPLDVMDLVQFSQFRVPIMGSRAPIKLSSLVLGTNNRANFIQSNMLNGISFNEFVASIMSLTRPQVVESSLIFNMPVTFESFIRTGSSVNNIKNFKHLVGYLKNARYTFEDGLQCNSVNIISPHHY